LAARKLQPLLDALAGVEAGEAAIGDGAGDLGGDSSPTDGRILAFSSNLPTTRGRTSSRQL
jgi:hypothetical protein